MSKDLVQVEMDRIPTCNFCENDAEYDGATSVGPWAYMCETHFSQYGTGLGLGVGQKLVLGNNNDLDSSEIV